MRIASFAHAPVAGTETLDFFSPAGLAGFDAVICDLEGVLDGWLAGEVWQSKAERLLSGEAHGALVEALARRSRELRRFIDEGKPAVFFAAVFPALRHVDRQGRWVDVADLGDGYPARGTPLPAGAAGQKAGALELRGAPELVQFGERLKKHWRPHAALAKYIGPPAFFLEGRVAGAFLGDEKRWVLTCPRLEGAGWSDFAAAFTDFYRASSDDTRLPELPAWHDQYLIPGEAQMAGLLEQIEKALAEVTAMREQKLAEKRDLGYLKRLFTDEGPSLRHAVATALKGMGFEVQPGARGKDELIVKAGEATAIVLVRGKTTAASDADAVELDKAVQRYAKAHGVMPKGILVVNSFRDLPLLERREATYSIAMQGYARKRDQCLVTGLQLLCLTFDARRAADSAPARDELLQTVGQFLRFRGGSWLPLFGASEPEGNSGSGSNLDSES
jgi:hypothetical protein